MGKHNEGLDGVESIRLGGMSIDNLPIGESAVTKQQWPTIIEDNKRQEAQNIIALYPRATVSYCESRVTECNENIERIRKLKSDQNQMISDYSSQVSLCKFRDTQLEKLDAEKDRESIIKLKQDFPAYNVEAMNQQIVQCKETIERCDEVIDKEHKSISELRDTISQLKIRDEKLKPYGLVM